MSTIIFELTQNNFMVTFKYGDVTGKIIGLALKIHNTLGCGFLEVVYQRAMELECKLNNVKYAREFELPIFYNNCLIGKRRVDFLIEEKISVELKTVPKIEPIHIAQIMNYLRIHNLEVGLLINFGSKSLEFHRFTNKDFKMNFITTDFRNMQNPIYPNKSS